MLSWKETLADAIQKPCEPDGRTMGPTLLSAQGTSSQGAAFPSIRALYLIRPFMVRNEAPPLAALPLRGVPFVVLPSARQLSLHQDQPLTPYHTSCSLGEVGL